MKKNIIGREIEIEKLENYIQAVNRNSLPSMVGDVWERLSS